jgi:Fe-S cluster assembly scaffold protein SufB
MAAVAAPRFDFWFSDDQIAELSRALEDPPRVAGRREEAFRAYRELPLEPNPLYRKHAYFAGVDLAGVDPAKGGPAVPAPGALESTLRVIHDASGSRAEIPSALLDAGVRAETLPEIWAHGDRTAEAFFSSEDGTEPDKLVSLGAALVNRAVRITVPDRCPLPVRVQDVTVFSRPHEALSVRRRVHAGADARVLLSEEVFSTSEDEHVGQRLYSSAVDVDAGDGARVHHLSFHAPDPRAVGVYARSARLGPHSKLSWVWTGFGGFRTRVKNVSQLAGQGAELDDFQTFYGDGNQAYDSAVTIRHIGTDTRGQSMTRGVYRDQARGISRGLVRIEREARKTVSFISEHAMLLSRGARSDTIPVLEILCRDVKATHSSSVAPVDPDRVFYLESRGIPAADAVRMIGEGFLSYVLERSPVAALREILYPALAARWERRPLVWSEERYPLLPALAVATEAAPEEWRFDAKLRG